MKEEKAGRQSRGAASSFKLWTQLGIAGAAAASMTLTSADISIAAGTQHFQQLAQGKGGEGGEAGQIEKEGVSEDVAFLMLLGLVEGHVRVGIALYEQGAVDMAKVHMAHPANELYGDLVPKLAERNVAGFAEPLERLAGLVEEEAPLAEARAASEAMLRKIAEARAAAGSELAEILKSIVALMRFAGEEYEVAVKNGKVTDPREYQDGWGFTETAKALLISIQEADRQRMGASYAAIAKELDSLSPAWPSIVPPETVSVDATLIHAAAARVELVVLSMR